MRASTSSTTLSRCGANSESPPPRSGPRWIAAKRFSGWLRSCRKKSASSWLTGGIGAPNDGAVRAQQEERAEGGEAKPGRQSQRPDPDPIEQQAEQKWGG